ncbi:hypothetical protein MTP04_19110 [Lysinibacillus sp. PLM2]|nr:hypothetical protein MTP04_19110 [Lysinibacillus sp. PLM2]
MNKKIEKKLFNLFTGEITATILFAIVYVLYIETMEWAPEYLIVNSSIYSFILLEFILLQGSIYWFLKWQQVRRKDFTNLKKGYLVLYKWCRNINLFLIAIGFMICVLLFINGAVNRYLYLGIFAFAIIEHINYYHIRLSYMSYQEIKEFIRQKGFRWSKLAKELKDLKNKE